MVFFATLHKEFSCVKGKRRFGYSSGSHLSNELLALVLIDRDVQQEMICFRFDRNLAEISTKELLAPVFLEELFDRQSEKPPIFRNDLLAPLVEDTESFYTCQESAGKIVELQRNRSG